MKIKPAASSIKQHWDWSQSDQPVRDDDDGIHLAHVSRCRNKRCNRPLKVHYWGEGYCSRDCMQRCLKYGDGERMADMLCDPTDPTGQRIIAATRDEIDAMLEAFDIDKRLPRIIYLLKRGKSMRQIDRVSGFTKNTCGRLVASVAPNLLHACGLRTK